MTVDYCALEIVLLNNLLILSVVRAQVACCILVFAIIQVLTEV